MDLMRKLWIAPHKTGSEMAKMLADYCGVLQIKRQNSEFVGKKGQYILNWGCGTENYTAYTGKAALLNPPELVDLSINKIGYFEQMAGPKGPRVPHWTRSSAVAKHWLEDGETVIARTIVDGCQGVGIGVMKKPLDFIYAPLYTIKVDNVAEYRVYMFGDEIIDYRKKVGKFTNGMCIGRDVEFEIIDYLPEDVAVQAKKAANRLKLLIQGLDVIWDGKQAWVLETNTAPWLGTRIASRYAKKLHQYIEEREAA